VRAAVRAIDLAYGASPRTGTWRANLMGVLLTVALATLVVAALVLMFHGNEVGAAVAARVGAGDAFARVWLLVQWPVVLAFVLAGAEVVYRYAPGRDPVQWRMATPGGVVFLVLWLVASLLLRAYFRTSADLGFAYGPLGAVVMLMLWLYLSSAALIIGGEVNAALRGPRTVARDDAPGSRQSSASSAG
jgi:membrane protein